MLVQEDVLIPIATFVYEDHKLFVEGIHFVHKRVKQHYLAKLILSYLSLFLGLSFPKQLAVSRLVDLQFENIVFLTLLILLQDILRTASLYSYKDSCYHL